MSDEQNRATIIFLEETGTGETADRGPSENIRKRTERRQEEMSRMKEAAIQRRETRRNRWLAVGSVVLLCVTMFMVFLLLYAPSGLDIMSSPVKVGLIMNGTEDDGSWNQTNYEGMEEACGELGVTLVAESGVGSDGEQLRAAVEKLEKKGVEAIFAASPVYGENIVTVAAEHEDIAFYANMPGSYSANLSGYFPRTYQSLYLAGIVAAYESRTGNIGFVGMTEDSAVRSDLNAFALGVQSVNNSFTVNAVWNSDWTDEEASKAAVDRLDGMGADVIAYDQGNTYIADQAESEGIRFVGYMLEDPDAYDKCVVNVKSGWKAIYRDLLTDVIDGNANSKDLFLMGLEKGYVGVEHINVLSADLCGVDVHEAEARIQAGNNFFTGPLYDAGGDLVCRGNFVLTDKQLQNSVDWVLDGVKIHE